MASRYKLEKSANLQSQIGLQSRKQEVLHKLITAVFRCFSLYGEASKNYKLII